VRKARSGSPVGESARTNHRARHEVGLRSLRHRSTVPARQKPVPVTPPRHRDPLYEGAIKEFEAGVRAFHQQDFGKAAQIFGKLADQAAPEVADRARMRLRLCTQRTSRAAASPRSAEDHYALGVAFLNTRELRKSVEHLSKAAKMSPGRDHVQYALAVSHALAGNQAAALTHLESACVLRPANRSQARHDEDLRALAGDSRFRRLVGLP